MWNRPMTWDELVAERVEFRKKIAALEAELETHVWEISPAMAQAKIDQLTAENTKYREALKEITSGNRTAHEMINWARMALTQNVKERRR
uniref:Uncharacterized protein n=1 Tax=viral metagenome TaxID=1070528 RepID=A0A6H2A2M1_9ZZZZ